MPPRPPAPRSTDGRSITAFVLSIVGLVFAISTGARNSEYVGNVAGGVGANLPAFIVAVVAVVLAIGAIRRTSRRAQRGKGLAITAIVLGGLTVVSCILHIAGLAAASNG
jgi:hypothetical protein